VSFGLGSGDQRLDEPESTGQRLALPAVSAWALSKRTRWVVAAAAGVATDA
jgi:hypothetical protein